MGKTARGAQLEEAGVLVTKRREGQTAVGRGRGGRRRGSAGKAQALRLGQSAETGEGGSLPLPQDRGTLY